MRFDKDRWAQRARARAFRRTTVHTLFNAPRTYMLPREKFLMELEPEVLARRKSKLFSKCLRAYPREMRECVMDALNGLSYLGLLTFYYERILGYPVQN